MYTSRFEVMPATVSMISDVLPVLRSPSRYVFWPGKHACLQGALEVRAPAVIFP